jgi:hypothetical protein
MAKQRETSFKETVLEEMREYEPVWCEKIQQRSIRGTPDILACLSGNFVGIELKVDDEPTPLQAHKLRSIMLAGGTALSVTPSTWGDTWKFLRRKCNLTRKIKKA